MNGTYWKGYLTELADGSVDAEGVRCDTGNVAATTARAAAHLLQVPEGGAGCIAPAAVVAGRLRLGVLTEHLTSEPAASTGRGAGDGP